MFEGGSEDEAAASGGHPGVLNVGFTRYALPLDATERKKYEALRSVAKFYVLGLSRSLRYQRFEAPARFLLLPLLPFGPLRFVMVLLAGLVVGYRLAKQGKIQIFLSQGPYEGLAGILLRRILKFRGIRLSVITEVHGDFLEAPFLYRFLPGRFLLRPILRAWSGWVLRRSDRIRAISGYLDRLVEDLAPGVQRQRFPTYTDFERFDVKSSASNDDDKTTVVSIGALYPVKGFDVLIDSVAKLPQTIQLRVVGDGPQRESLIAKTRRLGIETRVQFLGTLSPDGVLAELRSAHIFALASRSEGMGRVLIEALLCGVPVVAAESGGVPELVRPELDGFLVPVDDPEAMAQKIEWLSIHPDEARAMGKRGAERMRSLFSTEKYVEGYRRLLRKAVISDQ